MSDNQDMLNKRKQSLLAELESIKHLLDDQPDHIPVLDDTVVVDDIPNDAEPAEAPIPQQPKPITGSERIEPAVTEATAAEPTIAEATEAEPTMADGVLPGQQALFDESKFDEAKEADNTETFNTLVVDNTPPATKPPRQEKLRPRPKPLSKNPFLPDHVRQRLTQSGAPLSGPSAENSNIHSENASYTERLVDQLVAQYLPKIEAELRAKLLAAVNPSNKNPQKKSP